MIVEILVGAVITALFALIAYFLNRLITQNDRFQDETRRTHKVFGREITRNQSTLAEIRKEIQAGAVDEETKRKIKTISASLVEIEKELSVIKPALEKVEENYGQIILIGEKVEAQKKDIRSLYDAMMFLTKKQQGQ